MKKSVLFQKKYNLNTIFLKKDLLFLEESCKILLAVA